MEKVCVIGIGPGASAYLLPIAEQKAAECDLLLGSERALRLFADLPVHKENYGGRLNRYLERIQAQQGTGQQIGVVVAGDPGFHSLLAFLRKNLSTEAVELEVIPGVSSIQYLFAKMASPWQDYQLVSFHGREGEDLVKLLETHKALALLTDNKMNPGQICQALLNTPFERYRVIVGENLSYTDEKITIASVAEVAEMSEFGMSVVIIDHE